MLNCVERVARRLFVHNPDQIDDGQQPLAVGFPIAAAEDALDGRPHALQIGHVRGDVVGITRFFCLGFIFRQISATVGAPAQRDDANRRR